MTLMDSLARMEAFTTGRATARALVRHRHLSERPLVLVPLAAAGEAGVPLAALVGTDRDAPRLLTVPQPRDQDLRAQFFTELAEAMLPVLESGLDHCEYEERREIDPETGKRVTVEVELCADAPQLLVPNAPGVEFVRLLGRATRFRRTAEQDPDQPYPAPAQVPLLGRWLTHYAERARVPGSSLLLSVTELLGRHWATGQSGLEDQHLGVLLSWIDPTWAGDLAGASGAETARAVELARDERGQLLRPPAGPATDPAFDNRLLAPAIDRCDAARAAVRRAEDPDSAQRARTALAREEAAVRELLGSQLRPTWDAVWHAVDLLRALPEAAHAEERWKRDRWSYTSHRDRVRSGEPPQPRRDDAVTAARKLAGRESALGQLEAQEALDDPLVMAGRRLVGEAFAGEVVAVEMAYSESNRPRPLVTLDSQDQPHLAPGARVYRKLPDGRSQTAEWVDCPRPGMWTLRLVNGMGRSREPSEGSVPVEGEWSCWTLFEHSVRSGPELPEPEDTPWTHGGPPDQGAEPPDPLPDSDPGPLTVRQVPSQEEERR
ncbi:hypothetical protein [Streptomyces sp. NPDC005438]|uniref:hypothetical protein n=1 Tax=Streptomyces sp. NPDC005438 TaxID=3156880 RepID=UPI0033B5028B